MGANDEKATYVGANSSMAADRRIPRERRLAQLARRQHGVVSLRQLKGLGYGARRVQALAAMGRLHRIHRSVYAVGHSLLPPEGLWMAAVLAGGPGALLSHRSAATLWRIGPRGRTWIEIIVTGAGGHARPGLEIHRASLMADEKTSVRGVPCTSLARTLLDLACVVDERALRRAVGEAEALRIFDLRSVDALLKRRGGRPGVARLRNAVSGLEPEMLRTRSELERRFLELCSELALPAPEVNVWLDLGEDQFEVDFLWRAQRLIVEADSHRFHGTRTAFERDRSRDQWLVRAGWRVLRCTWAQVAAPDADLCSALTTLLAG